MSMNAAETKALAPLGHSFDVDPRSGFMPSTPPISRLPPSWEIWESNLDAATELRIQLGDKPGLTSEEAATSERWRAGVRNMPILPIDGLLPFPPLLRRAHVVLAFMLHFYIQSLPPKSPVIIPKPLSLPLLRVSQTLDIPPLLTYADTGLYNWAFRTAPLPDSDAESHIPTADNIRTQVMFTNLIDEEEFYLCASRIELAGVEILELMRQTMDETFLGDTIAIQRITSYLIRIAQVIANLRTILLSVKQNCDPDVYYNQVRPWFRGEDSPENPRKWVYEGLDEDPALRVPKELSGPSAGQSSMVHVIDIFLNVDHQATSPPGQASFMERMQSYMPRSHRLFLDHLKASPRPLRVFVKEAADEALKDAFNGAVKALKEFRDAHMIIATLYIIGPARRSAAAKESLREKAAEEGDRSQAAQDRGEAASKLKGTGGTHLVKFLKDTRTRTTETLIRESSTQ